MSDTVVRLQIPITLRKVSQFHDDPDVIARVYYPDEGEEIHIIKGLNRLEFNRSVMHELSHLFDWYLGKQSDNEEIREECACEIASMLEARCLLDARQILQENE